MICLTTLSEVRSDSGDSEQVLVSTSPGHLDRLNRFEARESTAPHNMTAIQGESSQRRSVPRGSEGVGSYSDSAVEDIAGEFTAIKDSLQRVNSHRTYS